MLYIYPRYNIFNQNRRTELFIYLNKKLPWRTLMCILALQIRQQVPILRYYFII